MSGLAGLQAAATDPDPDGTGVACSTVSGSIAFR